MDGYARRRPDQRVGQPLGRQTVRPRASRSSCFRSSPVSLITTEGHITMVS